MMAKTVPARPSCSAFTLIELLVVVAVIGLLISILLPALGQARKAAQRVGGASMQRQMFIGMSSYASANRFDIPGINTLTQSMETPTSESSLHIQDYPLTPADWISPSLDELPDVWEERAFHIFNELADPALGATLTADMVTGIPAYPIPELKALIARRGGMTAPSYQMPLAWQIDSLDDLEYFRFQPFPRRFDRIASPARKVAIADGTPHESNSSSAGDLLLVLSCLECENTPRRNGFLNFPPVNPESTAYTPESPFITQLSYRHPGKRMNVMHWDGHSDELTIEQSMDPSLWYPRGTEYLGSARPEVSEMYDIHPGDILN